MKRTELEDMFLKELKGADKRHCYDDVICKLFSYLKSMDVNGYINYLEHGYDWIAYFRCKRFFCQKYGYFVWGKNWEQALFQLIRPCRFLTIRLFKATLSLPEEFFCNHYEWEKKSLFMTMLPRCKEVLCNLDQYREIYNQLCDDESRRCFLYVIMGFLTLKNEYFQKAKHVKEKIDYYPKDIFYQIPSVIVDCGSYTGDTALRYLKCFGDRMSSVYLFEPDEINMNEAQKILKQWAGKIIFFQAAVAECNGFTKFCVNGAGGKVSGEGNIEIKKVSLDKEIREDITFIKMDIEGTELLALHGAERHIIKELPDMAICAYHKPEDIREIVSYIKLLNPSYKVYIRHYSDKYKETVLYFTAK